MSISSNQQSIGEKEPQQGQQITDDANTTDHQLLQELDNWNPMLEDYNSELNTLALNPTSNPLSSVIGRTLPIDAKIGGTVLCEHYAKFGNCVDGQYCTRKHVDPALRERIFNLQNMYECNRGMTCLNYTFLSPQYLEPEPDKLLLVSVTNAKSPNNFYLIAPYESIDFSNLNEDDVKFYLENVTKNSAVKTKLQKIDEHLAGLFDKPYRVDNVTDTIYLSQIVACKLSDGLFRRAMVIELPDDSIDKFYYKLLLLDVGSEVELSRECIYDIRARCLSEPPLALNCRLNLKPSNNQTGWSENVLQTFVEKTRGHQYLLCRIINFIQYDRIYTVDLLHLKARKSLTEVLLKTGQVELLD